MAPGARSRDAARAADTASWLDGVFEGAPIGLVVLDDDLVVRRINRAAADMCRADDGALGRPVSELAPFGGELELLAQASLAAETTITEVDLEDSSTTAQSWQVACFPTTAADGSRQVAVVLVDITSRHRFVRLVEAQREVLQQIAHGEPLSTVLTTLVTAIEQLAGGGVLASVLLLDAEGGRLRHGAGPSLPARYMELIDGVAIGPAVGSCGTAAWRRERVLVEDILTDPLWADFRFAATEFGLRACWSTPIVDGAGDVLGTFALYYRRPRRPSEEDLALVDVFARTSSLALERHRVDLAREQALAGERAARAEAEEARADLRWLTSVSEALTTSFSDPASIRELASRAVPRLADLCIVDLLAGGDLERAAVVHADAAAARLAERLATYHPTPGTSHPVAKALATGESVVVESVDTGVFALSPEHAALLRELDIGYWVCLPLTARGSTFGVMSLVSSRSGRPLSVRDVDLAHALARRAAPVIDNARLFARQVSTVRALQQGLLPPSLPDVPGLTVAAAYRAGAEGVDVGGDCYDLFEVPGGWAFLVGDVSGRGPEAAAMTSRVRDTARAVARLGYSPGAVVAAVNEALLDAGAVERFMTLAYGEIRVADERMTGELVVAGHPAPVVLRGSGVVESMPVAGMLLGQQPLGEIHATPFELMPGDTLLIVTDGVLEARRTVAVEGRQRLELFAEHGFDRFLDQAVGRPPGELADQLARAATDFAGGSVDDDLAILVIAADRRR